MLLINKTFVFPSEVVVGCWPFWVNVYKSNQPKVNNCHSWVKNFRFHTCLYMSWEIYVKLSKPVYLLLSVQNCERSWLKIWRCGYMFLIHILSNTELWEVMCVYLCLSTKGIQSRRKWKISTVSYLVCLFHRSQDPQKATKKSEAHAAMSGSHVSVASVAVPGVPDVQFVNADFFKQQYAAVPLSHRGGATLTSNAGPALVKIQRGSSVYQAGVPGQVMILKTDKEETSTPAGEEVAPAPTPTHTTKSSSLSRDISPSRITAQVVSAMSESSNQQPLLFTALTGKLPTSLMLSTRPDAPQVKQADDHRASPFERRHSPVAVDGRGQGENKGTKAQSVPSTLPFENLMRAAALFKAQEIQGGSSPSRPPGAGPQQQGTTMFGEWCGLFVVCCVTSRQHASVSQGRICSDKFTCCHTEIEVADPNFHLTQSQYTDTGPSSDPITPGAWQGSHWSANF